MEDIKIPTMVKIKEAAELTGLSYWYISRLCKQNLIVNVCAGRVTYENLEKLLEYLNGQP